MIPVHTLPRIESLDDAQNMWLSTPAKHHVRILLKMKKAQFHTEFQVTDVAVLCLEMTAVDATSTDGPARFAEVALKMGLPLGFAVDMWASSDLMWKSSTEW